MSTKLTIKFNSLKIGMAASAAAVVPLGSAAVAQGAPPIFTWTGFYVGAQAGGAFSNIPNYHFYSSKGPPATWGTKTNIDQPTIGIHLGYKRQFGALVAGVEADVNARFGSANARFSTPGLGKINGLATPIGTISAKANWDASLRGVLGYLATPRTLVYGTLGISWADFSFGGTGNLPLSGAPFGPIHNQLSGVRTGVIFGAGIEFAFNQVWRGRIEALHAIYGGKTARYTGTGRGEESYSVRNKVKTTTIRIGISRAFSSGGGAANLPQ